MPAKEMVNTSSKVNTRAKPKGWETNKALDLPSRRKMKRETNIWRKNARIRISKNVVKKLLKKPSVKKMDAFKICERK